MAKVVAKSLDDELAAKAATMNARFRKVQLLWRTLATTTVVLALGLGVWNLLAPDQWLNSGFNTPSDADVSTEKPGALPENSTMNSPLKLLVYTNHDELSDVLTSIDVDSNYHVVSRKKGWLQISLDNGLPIWVSKSTIKRKPGGKVIVTSDFSFTYSNPSSEANDLSGVVYQGEELRRIRADGNWVRVWSPNRFSAWIKDSQAKTQAG